MLASIKDYSTKLAFYLFALFLFLLAAYSKKFAYLCISIGPIPVYISELVLITVLLLRANILLANLKDINKVILYLIVGFLITGFIRLVFSVHEGMVREFGALAVLKQTALFYQSLWIFVALAFSRSELENLFSVSLLGIGFAQILGWLGFALMGFYSTSTSNLIGYPVGNETILPLYLFACVLWFWPCWAFYIATFGLIWITQFILYMKRSWVFSVLFFVLPLVIWLNRSQKIKKYKMIYVFTLVGVFFAWATIQVVQQRTEPWVIHGSQEGAVAQRANFPIVLRIPLRLIDEVYQNLDTFNAKVTLENIVFKGDLVPGASALNPISTMAFRLHFWKQAWASYLQKPFFGQGFGSHYAETQLNGKEATLEGRWISGPHNSFLAVLNRMGAVGFLIFLGLSVFVLKEWYQSENRDAFALVAVASFASVNFFALFNVCLENPQGGIWYWFFLGIILNSTKRYWKREK